MFKKQIVFFGQNVTLACDGNCKKAWGINNRPEEKLSDNDDDLMWYSDGELGDAPEDPGTYEGLDMEGKPVDAQSGEDMNRWCARECERSSIFKAGEPQVLKDWSKRLYNLHSRESENLNA